MNQLIHKTFQRFDRLSPEMARNLVQRTMLDITLLENVLDSVALGILVCDSGDNLILTNIYAKHLLPVDEDGTGTKRVWQRVRDDTVRAFLRGAMEAGHKVEAHEIETAFGGVSRLLEFAVHPLVEAGHIIGSVILIADITEKRAKEARMRRAETLASLTTLAAGVAHEIKNPLAAISIHMQLLKKAADALTSAGCAEQADFYPHIDVVNEEIQRLNKIVVDFLFAVRPMELTLRQTNINDVVNEVIRLECTEAESAGILCTAELDETLPALKIDKHLMQQALVNLVKNAIEAIRSGGDTSGGKIVVATKVSAGRLLLSVSDTGPGIDEKSLSRIFEPYWTTKAGGSGLGLTLVFKIVQEHNGEISARSQPGRGTVFLISLPLPAHDARLLAQG